MSVKEELRDKFASEAMQALIISCYQNFMTKDEIVIEAYRFADLMLVKRDERSYVVNKIEG